MYLTGIHSHKDYSNLHSSTRQRKMVAVLAGLKLHSARVLRLGPPPFTPAAGRPRRPWTRRGRLGPRDAARRPTATASQAAASPRNPDPSRGGTGSDRVGGLTDRPPRVERRCCCTPPFPGRRHAGGPPGGRRRRDDPLEPTPLPE